MERQCERRYAWANDAEREECEMFLDLKSVNFENFKVHHEMIENGFCHSHFTGALTGSLMMPIYCTRIVHVFT